MGKRGPRPKPTNLRVLHGDRSDRINRSDPAAPTKAPACPATLSPEARRVWRHYARDLHRRGLLTEWDRDTFAVYCEAVVQWRRSKELLDKALLVGGKRQGLIKNPAWQIMRDAAMIVRAFAQEFGLTPPPAPESASRRWATMASSRGSSPRFDEERAQRAQDFFEKILHHTKGRWARKAFVLAGWQRDEILRPLFGTVRYDDTVERWVRQYRVAWLELARKNGKSELLAGMALLLLCADDEEGAEVYGAAKDREQASLVFDVARRMVELSPLLSRRLQIFPSNKHIVDPKTSSFYRVIAADATGNLGQNPHGIVFDEVIAQPNRELWDALRTGMGARTQPLMVAATTAGNDPTSFAAVEHEYCEQISRDPQIDPTRFVYMRNTPKDADWREEANWSHANPALGDFLSIDALRDEAREADLSSAAQNRFRQFRLNQWVQQHTRWLDIDAWDASSGEVDEERLCGCRCFGGLDLASSVDLAALCWDFPDADGGHDVVWRFFIPSARIKDLDTRTGGRGSAWIRAGLIEPTEGEVIDYAAVLDRIDRDARDFDVAEIAYDRWGMTQLSQMLADAGLVVVPFSQTIVALSPPTKELARFVSRTP